MQTMKKHLLPLVTLAGLFLSAVPAAAQITVVNTGFLNNTATNTSSPQSCAAAFVPTSAAPVLVSTTPADNATTVATGADLVATFNEAGGGLTAGIGADPVGQPITTVTATASQTLPKLFVRAEVTQN